MGRRRCVAFIIANCLLTASRAWAGGSLYVDFGAGVAQFRNAAPLFGASTPPVIGYGLAGQLAAAYEVIPAEGGQILSLHVGAQYRYATGYSKENQRYYGLQSLYPMLRLEGNHKAHLTVGWTPYVLHRDSDHSGFDEFRKPIGTWGLMTELGYQIQITPAVSFIPTLGIQTFRVGTEWAPKPSLEGSVVLRFYIDAGKSFSSGGRSLPSESRDYQGWRYPFGLEAPK